MTPLVGYHVMIPVMVIVQFLINHYDVSILWIVLILILCQSAAGRARLSDLSPVSHVVGHMLSIIDYPRTCIDYTSV